VTIITMFYFMTSHFISRAASGGNRNASVWLPSVRMSLHYSQR